MPHVELSVSPPSPAWIPSLERWAMAVADATEPSLVIDDHGKMEIYDTGDHRISGVSQSQSTDSTLTFVSQHGVVRISDLKRVDAT